MVAVSDCSRPVMLDKLCSKAATTWACEKRGKWKNSLVNNKVAAGNPADGATLKGGVTRQGLLGSIDCIERISGAIFQHGADYDDDDDAPSEQLKLMVWSRQDMIYAFVLYD